MKKGWLVLWLSIGMCCYVCAKEPTQRIVSAGGSITEWIVALGDEQALVGVDTTSLYPEHIRKLPKVGYQRQLSAEGVASLQPTLVIGTSEMGPDVAIKQLKDLGVKVEILPNDASFQTLSDNLIKLGELLNKEDEARTLYEAYHMRFDQLQQKIAVARGKNIQPKKVVLVVGIQNGLLAAGQGTTPDWLIKRAGGENIVALEGYKSISSESLLALNPDVIIVANRHGSLTPEAIKKMIDNDTALALTNAAKQNKVVGLDASLLVAGLSPRLPDEAARLAAIFYDLPISQISTTK